MDLTSTHIIQLAILLLIAVFSFWLAGRRAEQIRTSREKHTVRIGTIRELNNAVRDEYDLHRLYDLYCKACQEFPEEVGHSPALGPDPRCRFNTIFRGEDLSQMTPNSIYLGDIYGIWTFTLGKWFDFEKHAESEQDKDTLQKIRRQFHDQLVVGFKDLEKRIASQKY